jgi:hypothetical protein
VLETNRTSCEAINKVFWVRVDKDDKMDRVVCDILAEDYFAGSVAEKEFLMSDLTEISSIGKNVA